ncbi:MAG: hypothetical protein NUV61_02290 [Candidatus Azambacteria bacterium]|nr:hypothetical protein [Candidatus Azambacteria bacterium]
MGRRKRVIAAAVISSGGQEHLAISWAADNLNAEKIEVVQVNQFPLVFSQKKTDAHKELKTDVEFIVKMFRARTIIVTPHWEEEDLSEKEKRRALFRAMRAIKKWNLPIERIIGIRFKGDGAVSHVVIERVVERGYY